MSDIQRLAGRLGGPHEFAAVTLVDASAEAFAGSVLPVRSVAML